jgi:hypothetical protein
MKIAAATLFQPNCCNFIDDQINSKQNHQNETEGFDAQKIYIHWARSDTPHPMSIMGKWTKIPEHVYKVIPLIILVIFFPKFQSWLFPKFASYSCTSQQEAYKFVATMDEVIRQNCRWRNHIQVGKNRILLEWINVLMELYCTFLFQKGDDSPLVLATQIFAGARHYDFKLSAWRCKKGRQWQFEIHSVPTSEEHYGQLLLFPLWTLPWLRKQMVRMLAGHDGTERIYEMPTMPEWATGLLN